MQLLGCTLFTDKSTNKVDPRYLEFVIDHDETGDYAWGVAALAYFYRQMGEASHDNVNTIAGLALNLQVSIVFF